MKFKPNDPPSNATNSSGVKDKLSRLHALAQGGLLGATTKAMVSNVLGHGKPVNPERKGGWNSLRAGNVDHRATLAKYPASPRHQGSRPYVTSFASVPQAPVTDPSAYYRIEQPGSAFILSAASDVGAVALVHLDNPGNPIYVTPGVVHSFPRPFSRLLVERPTQPAVPPRADLNYVFEIADDPETLKAQALTPAQNSPSIGASSDTAPGQVAVLALEGAPPNPPTILLAPQPGRRFITVRNMSPGVQVLVLVDSAAPSGNDRTSPGVLDVLAPGERITLPYTGGLYAWTNPAGGIALPFSLS